VSSSKPAPFFLWVLAVALAACAAPPPSGDPFDWSELPQLPLATGGPFAGESGGALVVAGGSHFPGLPAYQGGAKEWVDSVFVLPEGAARWQSMARLPEPRGYGASFTVPEGLVIAGGSNATGHTAEVLLLHWADGELQLEHLPELPHPIANTAGAVLGRMLYVLGGQVSPGSTAGSRNFWRLDLDRRGDGWRELEPWPGPGRILPAVAAQDGAVYLISGAELLPGEDGSVGRRFLTDAYRYRPASGWERIADVPHPVVAAPAGAYGSAHVLVFGGDTGEHFHRQAELQERHPGFSRDVLAYHTVTGRWIRIGSLPPMSQLTTTLVRHRGAVVIPTGEDRPAHRSSRVLLGQPASAQAQLGALDFSVLGIYLVGLVVTGAYFARRKSTTEEFFLAGRRIPWWAAGLSIYGTQLSALTFMAIPAKAYATNWVFFLVNMGILLVAPLVVHFYLPFFRRLRITTAYEYLELRFNLAVRWFGSISFILLQLGRMGIVVALPSIALSTVTGIPLVVSILLMGILTTLYSVLGGIEAVIWTDVLQVVVLLGGALVSLVLIVARVGGPGELLTVAAEAGKFHLIDWTWDHTTTALWVVLLGNFLANLVPYTSDQAVVQRYLTTPDEKSAARAIWTNALLAIPGTAVFFAVGTALFVFYQAHPENLNPALAADAIFPWFISRQLPAGIAGLVIAGIFAAAMSSLDSSMNSVATVGVSDFYRRINPAATDRSALKLARGLTVALGILATATALLIATSGVESLWDVFLGILGLIGGALAGVFGLGIFTRRAHGRGALIGALTGAATVLAVQQYTDVHFFLYAGVGISTCFVVGFLASLALPAPRRDIEGLTIHTMPGKSEPARPRSPRLVDSASARVRS
jgi:SSS family solute:Na+ symporter